MTTTSTTHWLPILFCLVMAATGCETLNIKADVDHATDPSTSRRINRFFWGAVNTRVLITDPFYPGYGIQCVKYYETGGEVLASILTLGIYSPINYSYRVAFPADAGDPSHPVSKNHVAGRRKVYDSTVSGWHVRKFYTNSFTHDTVFHQSVVYKRWAWGAGNKENVIPNSKESGGFQSLNIHVRFRQGMATFFTAGIYCPVTYTYRFAYLNDEY